MELRAMIAPDLPLPTLADLHDAAKRIVGHAVRTPLRWSESLSNLHGIEVWLKLETAQHTGAFKLRGASNALLALAPDARARGVLTYSTGNHGRALAHVARSQGLPCVVCLSDLVPLAKRDRLAALGAELVVGGIDQDAAMAQALAIAEARGMTLIDPIDDPHVIAGQGTIALEIAADLPSVGSVIVPLSGGGLFGGLSIGIRALCSSARLIAVSSAACPAMITSIKAGRPVPVTEHASLADSLGGGIGMQNRYTLRLAQAGIDDSILVDEAAIARAMRHAFHEERLVLEGAAAAGIAALEQISHPHGPVVIVVTGDNVDMAAFRSVVDSGP
jgi:threonine dehydratase